MTESDDPVTIGLFFGASGASAAAVGTSVIVGGSVAVGGIAAGALKKSPPPAPVAAENVTKTAQPVPQQLSEQARKNRRLAASFLTKGFQQPKLGQPGLLGLPGVTGQSLN